ncbi:MAG TPA: N-acyl homoserine lactonase family protein [Thermomicrobiaceae bacterium]|nr:N-acyl homoserine lactonase family protein [Thermomicrobiaceae bacterium]
MRLYVLQLGIQASGSPVPGYLIQTDDGKNVLVDTGYEESYYTGEKGPDDRSTEADWVVNRLAEIGLAPEDIDYLVCTHFDVDHAGSHDRFPNAEFVVQRRLLDVARDGLPRFQGTREHWDRPETRYRVVDGDTEFLPGIELIETSGHVPGHQSVLVRLPETGPVLLAIDAMPMSFEGFTPETRPTGRYDADADGARKSTRKLVDLTEREGVALTIYGHDPEKWKPLKKSPEHYE